MHLLRRLKDDMKILHLVPSAFHYFDDIRDRAMSLAGREREYGTEVEAYTIQYGAVGSGEKNAVRTMAPAMDFAGMFGGEKVFESFSDFDLIHLHLPMLGLLRGIVDWKKSNMAKPLVITYWRDVQFSDLFSYFIGWYSRYYVRRLFTLADAIMCFSVEAFNKTAGRRGLGDVEKIIDVENAGRHVAGGGIHLTIGENQLKLTKADMEALACVSIYGKIINK